MTDMTFDAERYVTWAAPGHFYSPIPDHRIIESEQDRIFAVPDTLSGIDLRAVEQEVLFSRLAALANELELPQSQANDRRYFCDNLNYGVGDALMLGAFLRHLHPRRYLEVGSGWSTALALDVNERWLDNSMKVSAIEPHPELLRTVIRATDAIDIIEEPVEQIPLERFRELDANDVLFIDSTHVVKVGSDAHYLINRVLPNLNPGVFVHIHDVFWPFEYSRVWLDEGRAWNENYVLQAFLAFNSAFRIAFFNNWFATYRQGIVAEKLPAMLENPGGAIWLRRLE